jgi:hypothetical protein
MLPVFRILWRLGFSMYHYIPQTQAKLAIKLQAKRTIQGTLVFLLPAQRVDGQFLGNTASNAAAVVFGACTAGSSTITHFGIGSDVSGTGNLFMSGALTASLAVSNGITPQFAIGALTVTAD